MQKAVAFTNNDVVMIAWSCRKKPVGCMGFAVYRIDNRGKETPLPSHAVFEGDVIKPGQTTAEYPVQKFYWKDPYARLVAEKTGNRGFRYKVVPLEGKPHALRPMESMRSVVSNKIEISSAISENINAFFNRGLISTQRISRAFKGRPSGEALRKLISDERSPLRACLSSDMVEALTGFVDRAKSSGRIYAALYELCDEELVEKLECLGGHLDIILSNAIEVDRETKKKSDKNEDARNRLTKTARTVWNRIMPSSHIGHNKFLVYVGKKGPQAVLLGSCNWTPTGLCAQTNNTLIIEDSLLARRYLDYWHKLAADTDAAGFSPRAKDGNPKMLQGPELRAWNSHYKTLMLGGGESVQSWFSPNTPKARRNKTENEKRPADMAAVAKYIDGAKYAILFLAFHPGTPSIANWVGEALRKNKNLFVRGCVTNKSASGEFYYELKGMTPPKKLKGVKTQIRQDFRVIGAEALDGEVVPKGWQRELLKAGFAIIHDKILVIDPFSDKCVVVTGSHNLGHKASYDNDENLVIIEGNKALAVAYAAHVLDVYNHFSWRYMVKRLKEKGADQSLSETPDGWMRKYFDSSGNIKNAQLNFWMQATAPTQD
jgi:hypothetical protein